MQGKPLAECPDNDGHNVDAIDALTVTGAAALVALARGDDPHAAARTYLHALRRTRGLDRHVAVFTDLLVSLASAPAAADVSPAQRLRQAVAAAATTLGSLCGLPLSPAG